ncbi:MAG: DUF362 domain-containing protein [Candidatus Latescibacteria bacterium]|jgi:uncharacterized protein (DUF362 family)|nr:DUF362 domain-containing protein [Candidatus Latescibacterota bacterium]
MKRRDFLKKTAAGAGSLGVLNLYEILDAQNAEAFSTSGGMGVEEVNYYLDRGREKNVTPEIRPEIRNNPRSVFLIETHVDARKDETGHFTEAVPQLQAEGKRIAKMLFAKGSKKGGTTFIKPNFTHVYEWDYNRTNGVYSSPDFIGGMVGHLRNIGNTNVAAGEGPTAAQVHRSGGVYDAFDEAGLPMIEAGYERFSHYRKNELNWKKTSNSLVWKRIPYFRPLGDDDNFLINVATLKCHLTGLTTLTVKNLQGCVPKGYGQFCTPWSDVEFRAYRDGINFKKDFYKDYYQRVEASFVRHSQAGFKRWDHRGSYSRYEEKGGWETFKKVKKDPETRAEFLKDIGPLMQHEMWLQRGLDNADVIKPDINIIEGIIGLDGEELHRDQIGDARLVNIIIAGCSPFEVDAVGSYIMGHDPREIWYTRVAKERGLGECDVNKIDIYWIRDGEIVPLKNISEIKRHSIGLNWARKKDPDERLFW